MDARELQDVMREMLNLLIEERDDPDEPLTDLVESATGIDGVFTFEETEIVTSDRGLVIGCDDGTEYQVRIVRSL